MDLICRRVYALLAIQACDGYNPHDHQKRFERDAEGCLTAMTPLKRLLTYFAPYKLTIIFGTSCVFMTNMVKLIGPMVLGNAIDDLTAEVTREKLLYSGLSFVGIALVQGVFLFTQRRLLINMSRHIEYDLRNDFYSHMQRLPFEFYQSHRTGDLMARATNDLGAVRMVVGPALMYSLNTIFAMTLLLPFMSRINWRLTLLAFLSMPLVATATHYFAKQIHDRFQQVQDYFGIVSNRAQEALAGVRVIRAYTQEQSEIESFRSINRQFVSHNLRLIKVSSIFHPILQFFISLGFIAVLWYGGTLVTRGTISLGEFVQFNLFLGYLAWPMIALGWVINLFQRGLASMGRMNEILSTEPAIRDAGEMRDVTQIEGEIEFRNLTFKYDGASEPSLKDINLHISAGQTVAFVGGVGSGKSTLMNLIPRLLDAEGGMIFVDGRPIRQLPLSLLRSSIGYVPQETFLFGDSIAENIAFGVQSASREDVEQAAAEAGIAEDIAAFPKGYDTVLGERGITLSGGQKQRTAIARALIRRPKILILDDALSAVDTYTEEKILRSLRVQMKGRTSLIVSHRVSTVKDADLIAVLDEGRIVERGTHDELIEYGGLYAELYEKQLLEEELAAS
jgi:ATP-binding cassette subfamily B protein